MYCDKLFYFYLVKALTCYSIGVGNLHIQMVILNIVKQKTCYHKEGHLEMKIS